MRPGTTLYQRCRAYETVGWRLGSKLLVPGWAPYWLVPHKDLDIPHGPCPERQRFGGGGHMCFQGGILPVSGKKRVCATPLEGVVTEKSDFSIRAGGRDVLSTAPQRNRSINTHIPGGLTYRNGLCGRSETQPCKRGTSKLVSIRTAAQKILCYVISFVNFFIAASH
jgi:hypothetical protein